MELVFVFTYLFIGIIYALYSKHVKCSNDKEEENPMLMLYMLFIMYSWPVFVIYDIFKK